MKRITVLFIGLMCLITGCNAETKPLAEAHVQVMPREMPADFNFKVRYGYGEVNKNEINTYKDQVHKDLVQNGTGVAAIRLTTEEMRSIYTKMYEMNVMEMRDVGSISSNCTQIPYMTESWNITVDGKTKSWLWSDESCEITSEAQQLSDLREYIHEIVEAKDAYKALPEAVGGYD